MNIGRLQFVAILFLAGHCVNGQKLPSDPANLSNVSVHNRDRLVQELGPLLKATGGAGRLYIHAKCLGGSEEVLFFPRLEVKSGTNGKVGLVAIQEALANNNHIKIAERRPGVIGITIGDVSNDILGTRIHTLRLGAPQQYNYQKAIAAIIDTREVQMKMREVRIDAVPEMAIYPIVSPAPKLPHLPTSMTDLTVDEALDRVAKTFGGLVVYEECQSQNSTRVFSILMLEL